MSFKTEFFLKQERVWVSKALLIDKKKGGKKDENNCSITTMKFCGIHHTYCTTFRNSSYFLDEIYNEKKLRSSVRLGHD